MGQEIEGVEHVCYLDKGEATWMYTYVQMHQTACINHVQCFVYQLYLNKTCITPMCSFRNEDLGSPVTGNSAGIVLSTSPFSLLPAITHAIWSTSSHLCASQTQHCPSCHKTAQKGWLEPFSPLTALLSLLNLFLMKFHSSCPSEMTFAQY
jgi:hypothetical protein